MQVVLWRKKSAGAPLWTRAGKVAKRLPKRHSWFVPTIHWQEIKICKLDIYFHLFLSGCFPLHWQLKAKKIKEKARNKIPFEIKFLLLWRPFHHFIQSSFYSVNNNNSNNISNTSSKITSSHSKSLPFNPPVYKEGNFQLNNHKESVLTCL